MLPKHIKSPSLALFDEVFQYHQEGRIQEAQALYQQILALNPQHALTLQPDDGLLFNLGKILINEGHYEEALRYFKKDLENKPNIKSCGNIAFIYQKTGRLQNAIEHYKKALELDPHSYKTLNNLGVICNELKRYDEAIAYYKKAMEVDPGQWQIYNNLGSSYQSTARLDEAIVYYKKALALSPREPAPYHNILLCMIYSESVMPLELAETARTFGENIADPLQRQRPLTNDRNPDKKLRIGYVSPDFREHAVNYFFEFLPKIHDRKKFEIYAYSNTVREDEITEGIRKAVDHWRDIRFMSDEAAADLIESDKIDILIDLAGHTNGNRLMVFARKPAPIQISWLGYPATTGMKSIDYRLTDNYAEPEGMTEHLNTEKLWRLPQIFCCYEPHEGSPAVIDHAPFEDNGYITFGCFNNFARVSDNTLKAWASILAQIPDARLLLEIAGIDSLQFRADTERRFIELGLPLERVIFEPRKKSNRFVLYNRIDIALDPFPAVGGTTSMDTLWMGVPFITLAGKSFLERIGVTILSNVDLTELIANNADEYVSLVVELARDHNRLKKFRHNLRGRFAASPAMDQISFVRDMESAYRDMWRKYCGFGIGLH